MTVDAGQNEAPPLRRVGRWTTRGHVRHPSPEIWRLPDRRVPDRRVTDHRGRRRRGRSPWRPMRAGLTVLLLLALPVGVFSAGARMPSDGSVPHVPPRTAVAGAASCHRLPTAITEPLPVRFSRAAVPPRAPRRVDVDGDGCRDGVTVSGGMVAVHGASGTEVYAVGEVGDHVMIGDWDCDGVATPLVHRPADGLVHEFGRWPVRSEAVRPSTRTVPRGGTPTVVTENGCHRLVVTDPVTGRPLSWSGTTGGS